MPLLRGTASPDAIYRGAAAVDRVYRGADLVWEPPATDPPVSHWFNFEGGTDGAFIGAGDTGSGVPFDTVSTATLPYSAAAARNGSLGHRKPFGTLGHLQWNHSQSEALHSSGCWLRVSGRPNSDGRGMDLRNTTGSGTVGGWLYTVEGRIRIMYTSIGTTDGQSDLLDLNEWYWISHTLDLNTDTARIRIYDSTGSLWHDSGDVVSAYSHSTALANRWVGPTTWGGTGVADFDDLQWNPGSSAPLAPWLP